MNRPVIVRKRGKTRGRPSKTEKLMELILADFYERHEARIQKAINDAFLYGCSTLDLTDLQRKK